MSLVELELPNPATLNHRWAAVAAVLAAVGFGRDVRVDDEGVRQHHDGGGNWASMALLGQGRALLFGHDHEYSDTYFAEAARYFGEEETDLLAGAPAWWSEALHQHAPGGEGHWIGFVYGWEQGRWQRAPYDLADGFTASLLPPVEHATTTESISSTAGQHGHPPEPVAVERLVTAGPALTAGQLVSVTGPATDTGAGVAAAARFVLG